MPRGHAKSLPVLMHHYINNSVNTITVPPAVFEEQCRTMQEHGWRGVSLAEAEAYFIDGEPLPVKSALITFDDGYLDNYAYAMPVLQRYGHKGVMFAVTARLAEASAPRYSLEDALAGNVPPLTELHDPVQPDALGLPTRTDVFCNKAEVHAMHKAGVLAVAGHSRYHRSVFLGEEYTGFVEPAEQSRTFYITAYGDIWGMPNFKAKTGFTNRAFLPCEDMLEKIKQLVPQEKAAAHAFFQTSAGRGDLQQLVNSFAGRMGRFETDAEMQDRLWEELAGGKQDLEAILGEKVRTLCWPWGFGSPMAERLALEAGYEAFHITSPGGNPPGKARAIRRFKVYNRKNGAWLVSRLQVYARPWIGELYARMRL
ncbi:polysaccharide deacetylase family protein [Desulfovibrio cuneatus]|uniref:polysaccharide deacetylase family protein n=1 Tax=Desulfovibrio cuneatus TaxID=159728 RepID=UPI000402F49E|nr:polysaccharide deacetylase family protein [Desulfovibrio cuneatus]